MSGTNDAYTHVPVMPDEVLDLLNPQPGETAIDGTVGLGGHARIVGSRIGRDGKLICFDRDSEALSRAEANLQNMECRRVFVHASYDRMDVALRVLRVGKADRILLDLGVSSLQLDKPERGFSFMRDGPLDMRMDQSGGMTAADIVNSWSEEELRDLFKTLGEERFSGRIAKRIVEARAAGPILTTGELAELAGAATPFRGRTHPGTRIFQALRMKVNAELDALSLGLAAAGKVLRPGGRLAVLTFHSLEDRLVKRTFIRWLAFGMANLVTVKPVACGRKEATANRRARGAKLRVVERI